MGADRASIIARPVPDISISRPLSIVVRDIRRDPQGLVGRVSGHVRIEPYGTKATSVVEPYGTKATSVVEPYGTKATCDIELCLVQVDRRATGVVASLVRARKRWEDVLVPQEVSRSATNERGGILRLDFSLELQDRMTPSFVTVVGARSWELRVVISGERTNSTTLVLDVPDVRRTVHVARTAATQSDGRDWHRFLPPRLRPSGYALGVSARSSGQASLKSRGDWGVVDVPRSGVGPWQASLVLFERCVLPVVDPDLGLRTVVVQQVDLLEGPNTLEFEVPAGLAPTHAGPLIETWYELRVHTVDGRHLGAKHRMLVGN